MTDPRDQRRRFGYLAAAGITFQGGSAAVDSATVMAALVHRLTGSALAVGAVTAILRVGWLAPQIVVGFLAGRRGASLPYFRLGAFGRAACLAALAAFLAAGTGLPGVVLAAGFFVAWTAYAFVSGVVAVPYNDVVGRSVVSDRRSRLLAVRFLGGGLVGLGVAAVADRLVTGLPFPVSYAAVVGIASGLMFVSSFLFVRPGEPPGRPAPRDERFATYLRDGIALFRRDTTFRRFVLAQWGGAAATMALPFYVVAASGIGFDLDRVALLLGAQTAGSLAANPLWGWWGDRYGKRSLLAGVALLRAVPPLAMLAVLAPGAGSGPDLLLPLLGIFFLLGGLASGVTIAVLGFLMEISPDDRRPAFSGYFNALTALAYLLPLAGGALFDAAGPAAVFAAGAAGAAFQAACVRSIREGAAPRAGG